MHNNVDEYKKYYAFKRTQQKSVYAVWYHSDEILEQAKIIYSDNLGFRVSIETLMKSHRKELSVDDENVQLVFSWVYMFAKTHTTDHLM